MMVVWFGLQAALILGAVEAMGAAAWRRLLSLALLVAALYLPFAAPLGALPRALLAAPALLAIVKVLQVSRDPAAWTSPGLRAWHAFMPFDVLATTRVPAALDRGLLAWMLAHAALAGGALAILATLPRVLVIPQMAARLVLGAVFAYAGMEAATEAVRLVHRLAGIDVPPLQDRPIHSRSIREFWNRRWNRPVSGWLGTFVHEPVAARKGPEWGLFAAFVASGLLHGWMFLAATGWIAAIMATLFFVFQALFVLVESAIDVRKASPRLQRLWTAGLLALSSPLFVDPLLRVLGL
jgi:hypothetical protein